MIIFLGNDHTTKLFNDVIKSSKNDKDIVVSCQYRYKIPDSLIKSHTCINLHYGTLPQYAGCNPIYWQMLEQSEIGVTAHYVDNDFDSGDIIRIKKFPCGNITADEAYDHCGEVALELFKEIYPMVLNDTAPREKQNKAFRNYKSTIDFSERKKINTLNDRALRALHFKGKQYPVIEIDGMEYEIRRYNSSI